MIGGEFGEKLVVLASPAAFGYGHNDPVLVNIKPDIRDTPPKTRLLCMRLGTGQSGATLATCIP